MTQCADFANIEVTNRDAERIQPLHEVTDRGKLLTLNTSMTDNGWRGAPVVVIAGRDHGWGPTDPQAVTGSHRIAAAREVGIDVPTVDLDDLLRSYGTSLDDLCGEYCLDSEDASHYEAVRRLDEVLPASVVEYYGLDAH